MGGWRGALATVGVVAAALVGIAVLFEMDRSEPDLDDRSGLVANWSFGKVEAVPVDLGPRSDDRRIVRRDETRYEVDWHARPCALGPRVTVTGTPQRLFVAVDRHDVGGCDDSSQWFRLVLVTSEPVRLGAIRLTMTG
jgi:hypothetical protein